MSKLVLILNEALFMDERIQAMIPQGGVLVLKAERPPLPDLRDPDKSCYLDDIRSEKVFRDGTGKPHDPPAWSRPVRYSGRPR